MRPACCLCLGLYTVLPLMLQSAVEGGKGTRRLPPEPLSNGLSCRRPWTPEARRPLMTKQCPPHHAQHQGTQSAALSPAGSCAPPGALQGGLILSAKASAGYNVCSPWPEEDSQRAAAAHSPAPCPGPHCQSGACFLHHRAMWCESLNGSSQECCMAGHHHQSAMTRPR